jgi:hypothetical protein
MQQKIEISRDNPYPWTNTPDEEKLVILIQKEGEEATIMIEITSEDIRE